MMSYKKEHLFSSVMITNESACIVSIHCVRFGIQSLSEN